MKQTEIVVLILAAFCDYLIGDPPNLIHPVQVMGWIINKYTKISSSLVTKRSLGRILGIILGISLIGGSAIITWLIIFACYYLHPYLGYAIEIILLASCFALKSLRQAAEDVLEAINQQNLALARTKLSFYVGRDTENLSQSEIYRAVLETVAENATDGVTSPLFYAILGALIPGVGAAPLSMAYKAASTLDSMVGYRQAPYEHLGWFSAQLEDRLTWLPCRLTVLTLSLLAGKPRQIWALCRRDANLDPSPNSGWSECVYAGILGVQLGGINYYQGVKKVKPLLGDALQPITALSIKQALNLTRYCFLLWLTIGIAVYYFIFAIKIPAEAG
ncbi:MAG: cobalamin biosynthesis protein [Cyanobacteria bacterium J083]|nr:MAG: cobalamin biosynthesis protein [Cyanobacteria bacterium J083]